MRALRSFVRSFHHMFKTRMTDTSMAEPSKKNKLQDFPSEMKGPMKEMQDLLSLVRTKLTPLMEDNPVDLSPLETARLDLTSVYAINSLYWVYLTLKGENPKDHHVMRELNRLKAYMTRLKQLQTKETMPCSQNKDVVSRIIRNALFDPKKGQGPRHVKTEVEDEFEEEHERKRKKLKK